MPSIHVCSMFAVRVRPHFVNQAPPGAQQLSRPDFFKVPHLGHMVVDEMSGARFFVVAVVPVIIGVAIEMGVSSWLVGQFK